MEYKNHICSPETCDNSGGLTSTHGEELTTMPTGKRRDAGESKIPSEIIHSISGKFSHPAFLITILLILVIALAACGKDEDKEESQATQEPVYTIVKAGSLKPGDSIPAPAGDVVLTVTGSVRNFNDGNSIVMDVSTIESVGEVEYTVNDPFEEVEVTYGGVLMRDLIALWDVDPEATTLSFLALNDYQVDVSLKDVLDYPVVFAMKRNSEYMPVSTRGPAMLVFPYDDFEFDKTVYNDYWVWQIKSIDIH